MTTWFTADEHYHHANIARYENRPQGWQQLLIANHNSVVVVGDTVYHLGDFSFSNSAMARMVLEQLNGYHILILGNHDRQPSWAFGAGFAEVYGSRKRAKYDNPFWMRWDGDPRVILSHAPLAALPPGGILNLHGHIHSNGYPTDASKKVWHRNVGVDVCGMVPVAAEESQRK